MDIPNNYMLEVEQLGNCILNGETPHVSASSLYTDSGNDGYGSEILWILKLKKALHKQSLSNIFFRGLTSSQIVVNVKPL